jgi:hypothetical protein
MVEQLGQNLWKIDLNQGKICLARNDICLEHRGAEHVIEQS